MKWFTFICILLTIQGFGQSINRMVYLQNEKIKVGLLKDVGGRVVFFGTPSGNNFLYSDSTLWNEPERDQIVPSPKSDFKAYNGFITWVGPQSQWWNQQEENNSRKNAVWPPDPFIEYGNYTVQNQTENSITIVGQASKISGVQLTKIFVLNGSMLEISVTARNCREENVSWDLWSNIRFDAFSKFSIPASEKSLIKMQKEENQGRGFVAHTFNNNRFSFLPQPTDGKLNISKAFLFPNEGAFYIDKDFGQMIVHFDLVDRKLIHPEQALVEVYNCISPDGETDILELEHHSAYKTLQPGESMTMKETWEIKQ